jgi:hypothetical protein
MSLPPDIKIAREMPQYPQLGQWIGMDIISPAYQDRGDAYNRQGL